MMKKLTKDYGILDRYARLLDSSIRIPGTKRTVGIDPIIGLIPGVGDVVGYLFSSLLLLKMVQHGASLKLALKMAVNVILDALMGAIPVVGILFDFTYKANERNLRLLKEYHEEGKHAEPVFWKLVLVLSLGMLLILVLIGLLLAWLWSLLEGIV